jgi:hypothetical protein
LEDPEVGGKNILKKDVKIIRYEVLDWINLIQIRDKLWVLSNTVLNFSVA